MTDPSYNPWTPSLVNLDPITQALVADVERVRESSPLRVPIVFAVHERVATTSELVAQVVAALRELQRGIRGWELDGIDGASAASDARLN